VCGYEQDKAQAQLYLYFIIE